MQWEVGQWERSRSRAQAIERPAEVRAPPPRAAEVRAPSPRAAARAPTSSPAEPHPPKPKGRRPRKIETGNRPVNLSPAPPKNGNGKPVPVAPASQPASVPVRVEAWAAGAPARERPRRTVAAPSPRDVVDLRDGETVSRSLRGRVHLRRATLVLSAYTVALATRGGRRQRWIPLEEVEQIELMQDRLTIDACIEHLAFRYDDVAALTSFRDILEHEVTEARMPGGRRHHPDVMEDWCQRSIEVWESKTGRLRLWASRYPGRAAGILAAWFARATVVRFV